MIPHNKLFEIIEYAGEHGFNTQIWGNFGTVEISMHDEEIIRYNWKDPKIRFIKTYKENFEESSGECSISWIEDEAEYYTQMLKIAKMLQESLEPTKEGD